MIRQAGGAGLGGGLLFVALVLFLAYLAAGALAGLLRLAVTGLLLAAAAVLLVGVLRRG